MRFKGYMRRVLGHGDTEFVPFEPEHYKQVGVMPSPYVGMPVLEAFQLVNLWNQQANKFVFWLEA
jgi:lipid A disaccharide synthetase